MRKIELKGWISRNYNPGGFVYDPNSYKWKGTTSLLHRIRPITHKYGDGTLEYESSNNNNYLDLHRSCGILLGELKRVKITIEEIK